MNDTQQLHWVFRAHVVDRAGALTSIASAFSNEGISIETVVGHGFEKRGEIDGSVVLTFCCAERDKDKMVRKVRRLSKVKSLEEHPYDSHHLRKSAVIRTTRQLHPHDAAGETAFLTCEPVQNDADTWTHFLAGAPSELDPILERLESAGIIRDIVFSIIGL